MRNLFILGHPGLYGGAATELHHQIMLWEEAFPDIRLHLIPTMQGYQNEPLYQKMVSMGVKYYKPLDFSAITKDDAIINFCSSHFLSNLDTITKYTDKTIFVNCMTFLFDDEKKNCDKIKFQLYQRPQIRDEHESILRNHGSKAEFIHFHPYFCPDGWEFSVKDQQKTNIGRISRQDTDKFSKDVLHIYEYIVSPKMKEGYFLGFDHRSEKKIGKPMSWIKTFKDQNVLPVKNFYNLIDFIVQSTDTKENWPRIGFEAMFSGKPLVVDNRGGWQYMIDHGVNGFLCNHARDFIYYGSRLSYDLDLRQKIAENALKKAQELSSFEVSRDSWKKVFDRVYNA